MQIWVDGYNFIRLNPEIARHEANSLRWGRERAIYLLTQYARSRGVVVHVVFDARDGGGAQARGHIQEPAGSPVIVHYFDNADEFLMTQPRPGDTVVTSDRTVSAEARRRKNQVVDSVTFFTRIKRELSSVRTR